MTMTLVRQGARYLNPGITVFTFEESRRVDRFIMTVPNLRVARARLGIGEHTLDAARDQGRMQAATKAKVLAALDREEAVNADVR